VRVNHQPTITSGDMEPKLLWSWRQAWALPVTMAAMRSAALPSHNGGRLPRLRVPLSMKFTHIANEHGRSFLYMNRGLRPRCPIGARRRFLAHFGFVGSLKDQGWRAVVPCPTTMASERADEHKPQQDALDESAPARTVKLSAAAWADRKWVLDVRTGSPGREADDDNTLPR
jgi:hypothetical protein